MSQPDIRPEKMNSIEVINKPEDWFKSLTKHPAQQNYLAMYSSWSNSIVTIPGLMVAPMDDHLVHRGDGVFEALKVESKKIYLLDAHLARMFKSMELISLKSPFDASEMKRIILQVVHAAKESNLLLRLYVSRGPGGFGVDPKESVGSQFYVVASKLKKLDESVFRSGVKAISLDNHLKDGIWSTVKSCNYLPNVMMKMEANKKGVYLSINKTKDNFLGEGSTENVMILNSENKIIYPPFDYTLRGTTLIRLIDLINTSSDHKIEQRNINMSELYSAKQVMAVGTTQEVLSIVEVDGKKIGDGNVAEFSNWARSLLAKDVQLTPAIET